MLDQFVGRRVIAGLDHRGSKLPDRSVDGLCTQKDTQMSASLDNVFLVEMTGSSNLNFPPRAARNTSIRIGILIELA